MNKEDIIKYLKAKRLYYCPDHPLAAKEDYLSDMKYDTLEMEIRKHDPDHPVLDLVGWSDEYMELVK